MRSPPRKPARHAALPSSTCVTVAPLTRSEPPPAGMSTIAADLCNAARPMMFSLGCIQALKCNTNGCPAGVATQDPALTRGLVVSAKIPRVANFHRNTVHAALEMLGAAGLSHPDQLRPEMIFRRVSSSTIRTYAEIYSYYDRPSLVNPGSNVPDGPYHQRFARAWKRADPDQW